MTRDVGFLERHHHQLFSVAAKKRIKDLPTPDTPQYHTPCYDTPYLCVRAAVHPLIISFVLSVLALAPQAASYHDATNLRLVLALSARLQLQLST